MALGKLHISDTFCQERYLSIRGQTSGVVPSFNNMVSRDPTKSSGCEVVPALTG